ncbi:AbrB/MazE/SpoVT family DNA-binding domain-containing protein [Thermococcus thioreducens]|uniref:AbrB/MazE/SpoVT family DNA-binding domain-containing protein n=1 Tax=Thermococcus thioreducens TaxID=277988 RepID=UPI001E37B33C|nr:AbrB/MazE/SpoVT family DNA-binding domain-containing protein [Thermococcus thioreducens]
MGKVGLTKVDTKGRVVIPKDIRKKMGIRPGEEFLITEIDGDTIVMKRFDVKKMLEEMIKNAKGINLEELKEETEKEGNRVAKELYGL